MSNNCDSVGMILLHIVHARSTQYSPPSSSQSGPVVDRRVFFEPNVLPPPSNHTSTVVAPTLDANHDRRTLLLRARQTAKRSHFPPQIPVIQENQVLNNTQDYRNPQQTPLHMRCSLAYSEKSVAHVAHIFGLFNMSVARMSHSCMRLDVLTLLRCLRSSHWDCKPRSGARRTRTCKTSASVSR